MELTKADLQERIRAAREAGWAQGYDACRQGQQRHNPYRVPQASTDGLHVGPYGVGPSQDDR